MKNLNIDGVENIRTKVCRYKSFDIAKLEVYFKIIDDDVSDKVVSSNIVSDDYVSDNTSIESIEDI